MADPWRMCVAGTSLRAEINVRWPKRGKASDGGIGDAAHASRSSDHNPWVKKPPPPNMGVVRAIDTDVDGIDAAWLAEHIRKRGAVGDPRLINGGYVIFNRRITTQDWKGWKAYTGTNPHTSHVHVSFTRDLAGFDLDTPWGVAAAQEDGLSQAEVDQIKAHIDRQVGFARSQMLTALGVDDTVNAPTGRTPEANATLRPARREDIAPGLAELAGLIKSIPTSGAASGPPVLTDADVQRIASAVLAELSKRTAA